MHTIPKKLFVIGLVIFYFALDHSVTGVSEPNNLTPTESQQSIISEGVNEMSLIKILTVNGLGILLGFVLGLSGTIFVDCLRRRRSKKDFIIGMRSELKQVLGRVNWYAFNRNSELNADKIRSMQNLSSEFDLQKILNPLGEDFAFEQFINRNLTDQEIEEFVAIHKASISKRIQSDVFLSFRTLKYNFIQNNISSISFLPRENQALLLNILRTLEAINEVVLRLDFFLHKSYDNVTAESHSRLKTSYLKDCQVISDWSYETAKEIANFLRKMSSVTPVPGAVLFSSIGLAFSGLKLRRRREP